MTATVHDLPAVDLCPACDCAMANRRGIYTCGYCGARFERAPDARLVSTSGEVSSRVRVWVREKRGEV